MPRRHIEPTPHSQAALQEAGRPAICGQIRRLRLQLGMEQQELARSIGVSKNTVSNWEMGRSRPDINNIPALCGALQASPYDLFGMRDTRQPCTGPELRHLQAYRNLTPGHRAAVDRLTDALIDVQEAEACPALIKTRLSPRSLAAGIGDPSDVYANAEPFYLYAGRDAERTDIVYPVNGDSMEPTFFDGDYVMVQALHAPAGLRFGEIGAFLVDGAPYVKEYRADGLHSHNPRYPVIRPAAHSDIRLIGRVLCKVTAVPTEQEIARYTRLHPEER